MVLEHDTEVTVQLMGTLCFDFLCVILFHAGWRRTSLAIEHVLFVWAWRGAIFIPYVSFLTKFYLVFCMHIATRCVFVIWYWPNVIAQINHQLCLSVVNSLMAA